MPINKKQLQRLTRLAAKLKENRYPNCKTFAEELTRLDVDNNLNIACTQKTIFRDIQTLKKEFKAPIAFDRTRNGYYLKHHGWTFNAPYIHSEEELLAAVMGASLAEQIFPEPLNSTIRNAIDQQLAEHNPDFLDSTGMDSLVLSNALEVKISTDIFSTLFVAWQHHEAIRIAYSDIYGKKSERIIEPHCLIFTDGIWWVYGICHTRNAERSFAMHRIKSAKLTGKIFAPSAKIIIKAQQTRTFENDIIRNVKLHCSIYVKNLISAKKLHVRQTIEQVNNDSFAIFIPEISESLITSIILRYGGCAELICPTSLRAKICEMAKKIQKIHANSKET